jgi:hypothetical protein
MNIASFGCSLTLGTELRDQSSNKFGQLPSALTWPALTAARLGLEYRCMAQGGAGNLSIADRVLDYRHAHPDDLLIINWTFIDRFDYSDPRGRHFDNGHTDYLTVRPGESDTISDFYYRHLHSEYRDKITSLMQIHTVLYRLQQGGALFLMTAVDDLLMGRRWHAPGRITELQDDLAPYLHSFDGMNFLDWCRARGHAITAGGHPLETAHAAAAELMAPAIDAILRRA